MVAKFDGDVLEEGACSHAPLLLFLLLSCRVLSLFLVESLSRAPTGTGFMYFSFCRPVSFCGLGEKGRKGLLLLLGALGEGGVVLLDVK